MIVTVKLFAGAREIVDAAEIRLELRVGASVGDVRRVILESHPQLAALLSCSALSLNLEYARDEDIVSPDDELAIIPPVSGG